MSKQVYISADYAEYDGDRDVVEELNKWGSDNFHKVDFIDMSKVASGSVSKDPDCRICDLKQEFNRQINASSAVIFVVGDKTALRTAGSACRRSGNDQSSCNCTPYKQNTNGTKSCKVFFTSTPGENDDVGCINSYSVGFGCLESNLSLPFPASIYLSAKLILRPVSFSVHLLFRFLLL